MKHFASIRPLLAIAMSTMLVGCIGSNNAHLGNNTTLIKPGYVRLCKPKAAGAVVKAVDRCEIASISAEGNPGHVLSHTISRPDAGYGADVRAIDLSKDLAVLEIDLRYANKGQGLRYVYKALVRHDSRTFFVYDITCKFPPETVRQLLAADINVSNDGSCNISDLPYSKGLEFFRIALSGPWQADKDEMLQVTYPDDQQRALEAFMVAYRRDQERAQAPSASKAQRSDKTVSELQRELERTEREMERTAEERRRAEDRERCIRSRGLNDYADHIGASLKCGFN